LKQPPHPYETTTMLQEANRLLGFSSDKTMKLAQELFDDGLITYIRSDSTRVAPEARQEAAKFIREVYGPEYLPTEVLAGKQGAQDAHEAIRPTCILHKPKDLKSSLKNDQLKLYRLIYNRFLASQMAPAEYLQITASLAGLNKKKRLIGSKEIRSLFTVTKQKLTFPGYRAVYIGQKGEDPDPMVQVLKQLDPGKKLEEIDIYQVAHQTEPPKHFTESSLIKQLDKLGIGRPSTYASIIKTLLNRDYAVLSKKYLEITDLGMEVIQVLEKVFPLIIDYKFTSRMENELDEIAAGKVAWQDVVRGVYSEIEKAKKIN